MEKDRVKKKIEWELNRTARYFAFICLASVILFWNLHYQRLFSIAISIILSIGLSSSIALILYFILTNKTKKSLINNLIRTAYATEDGIINALEIYNQNLEFYSVEIKVLDTKISITNRDSNQNEFILIDLCEISKHKYSGFQSNIMSIIDTIIGNLPGTYEKGVFYIISIKNKDYIYLTCSDLSSLEQISFPSL